jgi:hypothetical protein
VLDTFCPERRCDFLQYFVQEWRRINSESVFWNTYKNVDGSRMSLKAISQKLVAEREHRDECHAAIAREKYGSDLSGHPRFSYMKAGRRHCCTRAREIARIYREIEGLTEVCG